MGWATPTESAALGCVASAIAAACYRSLTWRALRISMTETAKISVMILFIIAASMTFSQILTFSGATRGLLGLVTGLNLSTLALVAGMILVLLFLGCFMDQVSMLMITIPFFIPLAQSLGIPMLWLGVLMLIVMEVSFTTPPFGLILYVMKGVAPGEITMRQVYAAAAPFIGLEIVVLTALFLFPKLVTWLPSLMGR